MAYILYLAQVVDIGEVKMILRDNGSYCLGTDSFVNNRVDAHELKLDSSLTR